MDMILLVAAGGAMGSVARYLLSGWVQGATGSASFPFGILGGFTTFSAFANESMNLLRADEGLAAVLNVIASVALGLLAVWLGRSAAYLVWR